jgi:hypothetical protein
MKKSRLGFMGAHSHSLEGRMHLSLEEIEGDRWGEPTFDSSLVARLHRMRKVPLRELRTEDLRVALGQKVGVPHLLPLALDILEQDPFAEADCYPGDLLWVVARLAGEQFLQEQAAPAQRLVQILKHALGRWPAAEAPTEVEVEIRAALRHLRREPG